MQPGAKLQAYLGVIILQPHACTQRFRLRILRRTRSNAGRTSAGSLSGRIESIWETPSKKRVRSFAAVAAPKAVNVPVDTSPTVVKFPALAVLLMVSVLPVIPVAELSRSTLAAPVMLSELPDGPHGRQRGPGDARGVHARGEHVGAVYVVAQQLVAAHVPMRASESASRSVTETDSPSKAEAPICMLYRSSVPADCCASPGSPKCSFVTPPGGTEKSRRAVLQTPCEGRCR